MLVKNYILGIGFNNLSKGEILEYIENSIRKKEKKYYIVTPNPELLVIAHKDSEYKKVLNGAKLASADGIGIMWAAKILRKSVRERLTGVDLVENLCKHIAEKPITVGFLGGGAGVAEKTAECLIKRYPKLNIVFAAQEWESGELGAEVGHKNFLVHDAKKVNLSMQQSSASANRENSESSPRLIDILFVAFGSPKQELWIAKNLEKLPVTVAIGVGGAFDMISGKVHRAPKFARAIGLEWLFRLTTQPWRIKRQLRLVDFVWLVLRERFGFSV